MEEYSYIVPYGQYQIEMDLNYNENATIFYIR